MTLTDAAALTKKVLIVGTITLVVILMAWGGWHYYYNYIYLPSLPPVVEQPTLAFGPLPEINFPASNTTSSNFSYSLDTETGALPTDIPHLLKVYSVAQLATDLLALDRAKSLASSLRFNPSPEAISATQYKFTDDKNGGQLIVDLDTGNFKFQKNVASGSAESFEDIATFINDTQQSQFFKGFLSSKNLLKDQLKNGRTTVSYNNVIKKDSTLASVNLWQDSIEDIPIVTPKFNEALIKAVGTSNRNADNKYILMNYTFWPIDLQNFGTYPIKTPEQAFDDLKNGEGFVAIEPRTSSVSVTKVYLGYYLSEEYSSYLEPVYVFEGPDFAALVPALSSEYIEKPN